MDSNKMDMGALSIKYQPSLCPSGQMEIRVKNFNRLVKYGIFVSPSHKVKCNHKSETSFENKY